MNENIVEITRENAQRYLIEESFQRPVLVDFWAEWCAPCKALMPILHKLAEEHAGAFLLAKVDCDRLQPIAAQMGVQSLPTVMLLKDGRPLDGFVGAQPESAVRALLEKHLPKPWDALLAEALRHLDAGDLAAAMPPARSAWEQSNRRPDIAKVYAEVLIGSKRLEEAQSVLAAIPMVEHDADYDRLVAELELKQQAADSPEIQALLAAYEKNPQDVDTAFGLAVQYGQAGRSREALELLYALLQRDREARGGEVRKTLLDMIRALGKGDPLAAEYQRKLFALMY